MVARVPHANAMLIDIDIDNLAQPFRFKAMQGVPLMIGALANVKALRENEKIFDDLDWAHLSATVPQDICWDSGLKEKIARK